MFFPSQLTPWKPLCLRGDLMADKLSFGRTECVSVYVVWERERHWEIGWNLACSVPYVEGVERQPGVGHSSSQVTEQTLEDWKSDGCHNGATQGWVMFCGTWGLQSSGLSLRKWHISMNAQAHGLEGAGASEGLLGTSPLWGFVLPSTLWFLSWEVILGFSLLCVCLIHSTIWLCILSPKSEFFCATRNKHSGGCYRETKKLRTKRNRKGWVLSQKRKMKSMKLWIITIGRKETFEGKWLSGSRKMIGLIDKVLGNMCLMAQGRNWSLIRFISAILTRKLLSYASCSAGPAALQLP